VGHSVASALNGWQTVQNEPAHGKHKNISG
jgi:hypothetical protein